MMIDPTPPRIHLQQALATWFLMFLLTGSLFAVLFTAAMAAADGESFLEGFWPLGVLCGTLFGASVGLYLLMAAPPVSVAIPLLPLSEALETLTQEAQNCGYVLVSSTPTGVRLHSRRTLFGFTVQPLRIESAAEGGVVIIGPQPLVTQIVNLVAEGGRR